MITIGVDLSTSNIKTWAAVIQWNGDGANLLNLVNDLPTHALAEMLAQSDKTGIDCPLGWPNRFVEFLQRHQAQTTTAETAASFGNPKSRRLLAYRHTDLHVHETTGLTPLSVSADRIAMTAMHCADLLDRYAANTGAPVDRAGTGRIAEVYPAASLRRWGLPWRGYKTKDKRPLSELVDLLLRGFGAQSEGKKPRLWLGHYETTVRHSDDAFDAVIAACTARAVAQGQTLLPETAPHHQHAAQTEGWIHLPVGTLADLLGPPPNA